MRYNILSLIIVGFLFSCSGDKEKVIAKVDNEPLLMTELDGTIQNQLYLRLFDIYYNRKIALEHLLSAKLLLKEATNRNISVDSLLQMEVYDKYTPSSLQEIIKSNDLTKGIPDPNHAGSLIDPSSKEGIEYLTQVFYRKTEKEFVETLKSKYKVEVFLTPPLSPKIQLSNVLTHPLNRENKGPSILIVSDFNCSSCRSEFPTIKSLISKYQGSASFYFTHFSYTVSSAMIFAECAAEKTDFSNVYFSIFKNIKGDTVDYPQVARDLGVDLSDVQLSMAQKSTSFRENIQSSINILRKQGLVYTPSLIIDGRVYYGKFDIQTISEYIDNIIKTKSN